MSEINPHDDMGSSWWATFALWCLFWFGVLGLGLLLWDQAHA